MKCTKIKLFSLIIIPLIFISCGAENSKIGFVRSQDLIYKYNGMNEAQEKFKIEKLELQSTIDSLVIIYQTSVEKYNQIKASLSTLEQKQKEQFLNIQYQKILQQKAGIENTIREREDQILQGVLNQVNSYIEAYGKKNNYKLILGTTLSGSVLYGEKSIDLTESLLEEINKNYKAE